MTCGLNDTHEKWHTKNLQGVTARVGGGDDDEVVRSLGGLPGNGRVLALRGGL